ncbi:hypothetical protein HanXRQr2_Chr02g0073631 [Helianthus annuus]|uniref:Uncharacterized protein n=1 Tax=Helianthus annuus TaxID=4232 RepID=A0A9K3JR51_HELAN|nr:hypothetical protein HanXRQr2_Chr02g0073631 [Helianthus annuus]
MLWSFIKAHLNSIILVFLSACKQPVTPLLISEVCTRSVQETAARDPVKVPAWKDETSEKNVYIATVC